MDTIKFFLDYVILDPVMWISGVIVIGIIMVTLYYLTQNTDKK